MGKSLCLAAIVLMGCGVQAMAADILGGTQLELPMYAPAILSPDGKSILYIDKEKRQYAYWRIGVDGKGAQKLFHSSLYTFHELFTLCFNSGTISPDSKHFIALTTDNGKDFRKGGRVVAVIVDGEGKTTNLPTELGWICSAIFVDNDTVYYVDSTEIQGNDTVQYVRPGSLKGRKQIRSRLRRFQISTGKAETVQDVADTFLYGLRVAPKGKSLGACAMELKDEKRKQFLWAYDPTTERADSSPALALDDYVYDGVSIACWSDDGKTLYTNGHIDKGEPIARREFSILAWTPFATDPTKALSVLAESRSLRAPAAFGPGQLSVTDRKVCGVLDVKTDTVRMLPSPWMLLSRIDKVGLFIDFESRRHRVIDLPTIEKQLIGPDARE